MMSPTEALAEALAGINDGLGSLDPKDGNYAGYMAEAEEMIKRLKARGYDVTAIGDGND